MKHTNYLLFPIILFSCYSCSKGGTTEKDNELPIVTLQSPIDNQVFTAGETVAITGTLTDNKRLAEVHVHISNQVTGVLLVDIHRYPTTSTYALAETFQVAAATQYKIQVIAKDNSANENRATLQISGN